MMSAGFGIFIATAALANIAAVLWLIWWTARGSAAVDPNQTTHVWDEDLTELNNPLPRWWLWLFLLSIAFGLGYLVWYPGLGRFVGLGHWTEVSQYNQEDLAARQSLERRFAAFKGQSLLALSKDAGAMGTAKNLFALNCSACHGSDARGAKGFPNLTDQDWLWGGNEETVYQTIAQGRNGLMPAWGAVLGEAGVKNVMAYVLSLSGRQSEVAASTEMLAAGKATFATMCSACHGADGKGNSALGAPNLTDRIWLHGGSLADIRETITNGRTNQMPAHLERLGETKVRLLAAYVLSVSQPMDATHSAVAAGDRPP
jgi:cytochrome c oxidase cbb3-type subunit 3